MLFKKYKIQLIHWDKNDLHKPIKMILKYKKLSDAKKAAEYFSKYKDCYVELL